MIIEIPRRIRPHTARPIPAAHGQLLVRLLAGGLGIGDLKNPVAPIELPPGGTADWDRLADLARRHRVVPLLYASVRRIDPALVPPDLRDEFHTNAARTLQLGGELLRLLDQLGREQIPAIPFKGITLAARAYGDVALRTAGDLDLLVHRQDIIRSVDVLTGWGFRHIYPTATPHEQRYLEAMNATRRREYLLSHCEHHLVDERRGVNVDLHWAITLREFAVSWDTQRIWNRAMSFNLMGRQMPCLCDEDLLLVLCANGAKDAWERLDRVCDVAALLRRRGEAGIRWPAVFETARSAGLTRILGVGLNLAAALLEVTLPDDVRARISQDTRAVAIARALAERLAADDPAPAASRLDRSLFHLRLRERRRDRLRFCLAQLRPSVGDWAAVPLPRALGSLHYLIRPWRLLARYALRARAAP